MFIIIGNVHKFIFHSLIPIPQKSLVLIECRLRPQTYWQTDGRACVPLETFYKAVSLQIFWSLTCNPTGQVWATESAGRITREQLCRDKAVNGERGILCTPPLAADSREPSVQLYSTCSTSRGRDVAQGRTLPVQLPGWSLYKTFGWVLILKKAKHFYNSSVCDFLINGF